MAGICDVPAADVARAAELLVLRGTDDRLSTPGWARGLAGIVAEGRYVELAGAHTFPWRDPHAWSAPVRDFAAALV